MKLEVASYSSSQGEGIVHRGGIGAYCVFKKCIWCTDLNDLCHQLRFTWTMTRTWWNTWLFTCWNIVMSIPIKHYSIWKLANHLERNSHQCVSYCIAGNSREFWSFVAICESFFHEIWGCGIFWRYQRAICESFLRENLIFHQLVKVFSHESFPSYGSEHNGLCSVCTFLL